uniref:ZAD domain-containing protein n=1 Tax=Magallana gigas TaxID=29159 RepID=A0A8W8MH78_MAGGI
MDECILCLEKLPKKNRRHILSDTFNVKQQLYEVLGFIPEQQLSPQYTCYRCFNNLNRLSKIEFDLESKLSALKREKDEIINQLRPRRNVLLPARPSVTSENVGGACSSSCTPRKSNKRLIIRTPTPRKTKKILVQHTAQPKVRKRLSEDQLTPSKVKVHFRGRNDSKKEDFRRIKGIFFTKLRQMSQEDSGGFP